ncbi:MAG: glycosyltransferase 87 family protein [Eubacterium sp.]|nr:glycosyltransferase 87 family protein [Eubacterium sp.]
MIIRKKTKRLLESIDSIDWIILCLIFIFCFVNYQHSDILHTGGSSIAYLNGHILDFYDYNKAALSGNNYLPTTYILFAIWNIPIRILGFITEPTMSVGAVVRMWYKAGTFSLFLCTAYLIYKICMEKSVPQKKAVLAAFLFLSNPIAVYSEFIFGQYDIITTFFMCLGFYYYTKDDRRKFVLSFSAAITCKYFALLVFVPLLLLKEKNIWKIIRGLIGGFSLFAIETLLYITSEAFISGIFGFGAVGYIFNVSLDTGFAKISIVVVLWGLLCAFCYFKECKEEEWFSWGIYISCIVMFLSFGLSMWHPQWLMMAVPFLTLGMFFNKDSDIYMLLDLLMMAAFTLFVVNIWKRACDQNLFYQGIFARYISDISQNVTMSDLLVIKDVDFIFSIWAALLLLYVVFLHPKRMCMPKDVCKKFQKGILRFRYIGGCCIFIVPSIAAMVMNMMLPDVIYVSSEEISEIVGVMQETDVYEQVFTAEKETVTGIAIDIGTYMKENNSILKCELVDKNTESVLNELEIDTSELIDNQYIQFEFENPSYVVLGSQYAVRVSSSRILPEDTFTLYRMEEKPDDEQMMSYAIINGEKKNYDLSIMVYGK